jgi:hypothetical protein
MVEASKKPLPFTETYRWSAKLSFNIPFGLSSERRTVYAHGTKTWRFLETHIPGVAEIRPVDESITLDPISLVPSATSTFGRMLQIPSLTLNGSSVDPERSRGYVDLKSGKFSYARRPERPLGAVLSET